MSLRPTYPSQATPPHRDFYGRLHPTLPTKAFPTAHSVYKVDNSFQLTRPINTSPFVEIVKIKVLKKVDVGRFKFSQSVLARVEEGPRNLNGRDVFVKFFDPLYVNPDDLQTIFPNDFNLPRPRSSESSDSSFDGSTLAGSVEWSKKKPAFLSCYRRSAFWSENALIESLGGKYEGPRDIHNFPVENRSDFSARHFQNDLRAYTILRQMHGKYSARFLGHFNVKFEDRELFEDRVCKVLMLEVLDGKNLRTFPVTKLLSLERTRIREQGLEITTSIYEHGIFSPDISLDKFLLLNADKSLRLFGFSVTYDPEEFAALDNKERDSHVQRTIARMKSRLNELGYIEGI